MSVDSLPITVAVSRQVAPDRDADFARWSASMMAAASRYHGYLGGGVLRSAEDTQPWHMIFRFRDGATCGAWEQSAERADLLADADSFMTHRAERRFTGLETWFALPGQAAPVPPRWKMALVTFVVAVPAATLVNLVLAPALSVPPPLRPLLSVSVLVLWLTWIAMPAVTGVLQRWLYSSDPAPGRR